MQPLANYYWNESYRSVVLLSIGPGVLDDLQLRLVETHETQVEPGEEAGLERIMVTMAFVNK